MLIARYVHTARMLAARLPSAGPGDVLNLTGFDFSLFPVKVLTRSIMADTAGVRDLPRRKANPASMVVMELAKVLHMIQPPSWDHSR